MSNRADKLRILIAEPSAFSEAAVRELSSFADVTLRETAQDGMRDVLESYDVVWVRLARRVRREDVPERPRAKWVVVAATGTDHLDRMALEEAGVRILSLRGERAFLETISATAELALGLLLALARRIPWAFDGVRRGAWDRDAFRGLELRGLRAGIIGFGRLGRMMARYLDAMGMEVSAYDPHAPVTAPARAAESLDALLAESDVVSLHVPLDGTTHGLIGRARFARMKRGALLVNTSRGAVIDEGALLDALRDGVLGGAALDVLADESAVSSSHALVAHAATHDNLLLTPHIGGAAHGVMQRAEEHMVRVLRRTVGGENP